MADPRTFLTRNSKRSRRGTVMLEFVLILPLFLFLVFFTVDMGRMTVLSGLLSDTAYVSARAGAQVGYAEDLPHTPVEDAFDRVVADMPTFGADTPPELEILSGSCINADSYIEVEVTQQVDFVTPGLGQLLAVFGGADAELSTWTLRSRGTVLCEIVR